MKRTIMIYGLILAAGLAALKLVESSFFSGHIGIETYMGAIALGFLIVGVLVGLRFRKKARKDEPLQDYRKLDLTEREFEVLQKMAEGLSNQEIADTLFVSLNTVKTHISNVFIKLDVKRRTQAISRAKELRLIR